MKKILPKVVAQKYLKKGDIIDIVAPASSCSPEEFNHAVAWITEQGYRPRFPKDLLQPVDYLANTDQKRFRALKKALVSPTSKVVWCLRGGYGSIRLVPELLKLKKMPPKFFIGLSDITVIHQFLIQKWNWKTIHGPVLSRTLSEKKRNSDYTELFAMLAGEKNQNEFARLISLNQAARGLKKNIISKVMGGNLATFCSLLGTGLSPQVKDHFLFFEDISERGYKIDRMLQQLDQAGIFQKCRGVFFGDFIQSDEPNGRNLAWSTIENFFKDKKVPAFKGVESDHSEKQRPLFLNTKAELICQNPPTLKIYNN
ncbi:MAG: LD-carboxypeptidase [Moraxellaceae bacterium]|nr:LD-carboxypeptidase [Pseudobdellovibrionaceae bacterium]